MSTVVNIKPTATLANNFWAVTGPSAWQAVSDSSDTTFVDAPPTANLSLSFLMGNVPLEGAFESIARIKIKIRARQITASGNENVHVWLQDSDGYVYWGSTFTVSTATPTNFESGWIYGPAALPGSGPVWLPNGLYWNSTLINALEVKMFTRVGPAGGALDARVYEVSVDVEFNDHPVTTVTGPSGTVLSTNKPSITWTATDTEGDPIVGAEVFLYEADVVAAPEFDVSEDPFLFHSGIVDLADATSGGIPVEEALDNDTVTGYIPFVRTYTQHPSGERRFSDWDQGSTFFVNVPPLPAPDIVWNAILADGVPVYNFESISRGNVLGSLSGSNMEPGTHGWTGVAPSVFALGTAAGAGDGDDYYGRVYRPTAGTLSALTIASMTYAEDVNGDPLPIRARARVRAEVTPRSARVTLNMTDSAFVSLGTIVGTSVTDTTSGWTTIIAQGTLVPGTTLVWMAVEWLSAGANEYHRMDNVALHYGVPLVFSIGGRTAGQHVVIEELNPDTGAWDQVADVVGHKTYLTEYSFVIGQSKTFRSYVVSGDGSANSPYVEQVVGPHDPVPSGFWMIPEDGDGGFPVEMLGPTLNTTYVEEAATYTPLGRPDKVTISDGYRLSERQFVLEVYNNEHAARIRRIFELAGGYFWLMGTWPEPETSFYRIMDAQIAEEAGNTSPAHYRFKFNATAERTLR
jgi:hypothetical protein